MPDDTRIAAYGGRGWSARAETRSESGVWSRFGVDREWTTLKAVLLHRPGPELEVADANAALMVEVPDAMRARAQHDALAEVYREAGVTVRYVDAQDELPNQVFVADTMFMTPEGAIVGRPASPVRAGEERWAAKRLAELGIPILRTVSGAATFEGADALWVEPGTALVATGLRTNAEGARQVASTLEEQGVDVVHVELPESAMHLMGTLRILDRDLAVGWDGRTPRAALELLESRGLDVAFVPDEDEARRHALNVVSLGPRRIVMPAGNPVTRSFYAGLGVACKEVAVDEIVKAAGAIGCATGVLEREPA